VFEYLQNDLGTSVGEQGVRVEHWPRLHKEHGKLTRELTFTLSTSRSPSASTTLSNLCGICFVPLTPAVATPLVCGVDARTTGEAVRTGSTDGMDDKCAASEVIVRVPLDTARRLSPGWDV